MRKYLKNLWAVFCCMAICAVLFGLCYGNALALVALANYSMPLCWTYALLLAAAITAAAMTLDGGKSHF